MYSNLLFKFSKHRERLKKEQIHGIFGNKWSDLKQTAALAFTKH